jgi:hypothetical protein
MTRVTLARRSDMVRNSSLGDGGLGKQRPRAQYGDWSGQLHRGAGEETICRRPGISVRRALCGRFSACPAPPRRQVAPIRGIA